MQIKTYLYLLLIFISNIAPIYSFDDVDILEDYEASNFEEEIEPEEELGKQKKINVSSKAALVFKYAAKKDVPDSNLAMATLEAGPSATVGGCVSAISGDFFDSYVAMKISGAQPLSVQCSYCSSEKAWNFQHMPELEVGPSTGKHHLYARYLDDNGSGLTYRTHFGKSGVKDHDLTIPEALFEKGLTNCGSGIICGKTNWKNSYMSIVRNKDKKKTYKFTHGTGIERTFVRIKEPDDKEEPPMEFQASPLDYIKEPPIEKFKGAPIGNFLLENERYPNGNQLLYEYEKNKLTNIKAVNQLDQQLANISLTRDKKSKKIKWLSESGFAYFFFDDKDEKRISKIVSFTAPSVRYNYNKHDLLIKKEMPDERFLKIKYHGSGKESGRVSELETAMGLAYTFQYNLDAGETSVYDAQRNLTKYRYDKKTKRLQSIKRYSGSFILLSQDNFFWSDSEISKGNLIAKTFEGDGKTYFSRYLDYDDFGNVKEDRLFGNLTGNSPQPLIIHDGFVPYLPCECYVKKYDYSQDEQNLLKKEEDGEKIIWCDYYPNRLLKSRMITDENKILKREFFRYDVNGVLTVTIWDDGQALHEDDLSYVTERHLKLTFPRTVSPIGLPQVVEEYSMDFTSNQFILLNKTVNSHDPLGRVLQEDHYDSNRNFAYSLKWEYDHLGNITKRVDALGQTTTFEYDGNSNKTREDGPLSDWHKEFKYNLNNCLIEETEYWPDGTTLVTKHGYNNLNQKIHTIDPYGHVTTFKYNVLGYLVKTEGPNLFTGPANVINPIEETTYDAMGNAIAHKDANGHITKSFYTVRGKPYRIEYPDGSIEQKEYSLSGLLVKEIAKNGLVTTYTYDPFDRIIATHISDNHGSILKSKLATYSTFHPLTETDEEGIVTIFEYDYAGRRISTKKGDQLTKYEYDSLGRVVRTIDSIDDANVRITCKTYDLLNQVVEEWIEDQNGEVLKKEHYSYDVNGNKNSTTVFTQAGAAETTTEYHPNNKPFRIVDALGHQTLYLYNHAFSYRGQTVLQIIKIDPLGNQEFIIHDTHGNVCHQAKVDTFGQFIQSEENFYDALGQKTLSQIIVHQGQEQKRLVETTWEYDSMGNIIRCVEAVGTPEQKSVCHHYNKFGQKEMTEMPNGISIINEYDAFGRLSSYKSTDNTIHYEYVYNNKDRPILVKDLIHDTTNIRSYDELGRLKSETLDNGLALKYTYDQLDRPITVTLPDQSAIRYRYNAHHLVAVERIKDDSVIYTHYYNHYDLAGNLTEETLLVKAGKIHYKYDLLERPISLKAPHWQATIPEYGFDAVGNLLERKITDKQGTTTYTYAYDNLYQLISENGFISHTYQNDSVYNRIAKNSQSYDVNALNQILSQTNCSYRYDLNGNLTEKTTDKHQVRYLYDALDRLVEVRNGSDITTYTYDSFHRRLSKTHNGLTTHFLYQNNKEIGAFNQGKMTQLRVLGIAYGAEIGGAIALELDGKIYAPIHDPQGNVVVLVNPSGDFVDGYRYTAFGEIEIFAENVVDNPWRYSSKRFDPETSFIFFGRRYYDSYIGRWTTADPAGFADGPNLYAYVHNQPLIYIDPDGLFAAAIFQATMNAVSQFGQGLDFGKSNGSNTFDTIRTQDCSLFFNCGAILGATTAPLDRAFISTMDFLSPPNSGTTCVGLPSPSGTTTVIRGFLQQSRSYETFLAQIQRMQRVNTLACNVLKIPETSQIPILFGQKSVSSTFTPTGKFTYKSWPISEVSQGLKNGNISPHQLPIEIIVRDGQRITLNNRSLLALRRADMDPTIIIDRTGILKYEDILMDHLRGTQPIDVIRIRNGPPGTSLIN